MKINPSLGNSQPLRTIEKTENLSFQMSPVKVPSQYKTKASNLVDNLSSALKERNIGKFEQSKKNAARENLPSNIIGAAIEQAKTGQKLLVYA